MRSTLRSTAFPYDVLLVGASSSLSPKYSELRDMRSGTFRLFVKMFDDLRLIVEMVERVFWANIFGLLTCASSKVAILFNFWIFWSYTRASMWSSSRSTSLKLASAKSLTWVSKLASWMAKGISPWSSCWGFRSRESCRIMESSLGLPTPWGF